MRILKEVKSYGVDLESLHGEIDRVTCLLVSVFGIPEWAVEKTDLEVRMCDDTFKFLQDNSSDLEVTENRETRQKRWSIFGVKIVVDNTVEMGEAQLWRREA